MVPRYKITQGWHVWLRGYTFDCQIYVYAHMETATLACDFQALIKLLEKGC